MDPALIAVAVGIGIVVGLTGMGGGALMTPTLVLFFGVPPLTAVSSDIMASVFMKPVGSWVHIRRGTVNWQLVRLLVYGSVPSAFLGVLIAKSFGDPAQVQKSIKFALGFVLILAAVGLLARLYLRLKEHAAVRDGSAPPLPLERPDVTPRVVPTVLVGVFGGLIVGISWAIARWVQHREAARREALAAAARSSGNAPFTITKRARKVSVTRQ